MRSITPYRGGGTRGAYSNYWFGILLPIKVLLYFFKWREIRYILYLLSALLQVIISVLLYKKVDVKSTIAYLVATTIFCVTYNVSDIAAASDILLMQMGIFLSLFFYERLKPGLGKGRYEFFFVVGSLHFFGGGVWAPMYTLGMLPLIIALIDHKNGINDKTKFQYGALSIIFWILGYGITGLAKQGLAVLALGEQIGLRKLSGWSGGSVTSKLLAFLRPVQAFNNRVYKLVLPMVIICIVMLILLKKLKLCVTVSQLKTRALFLGVSMLIPWTFFAILSNATGHGFYCQDLLPFVFALTYVLLISFKIPKRE